MSKKTRIHHPATLSTLATFGARISEQRRRKNWSLMDLARRIDVDPATALRIERGAPTVNIGSYIDAAALCGVALLDSESRAVDKLAATQTQGPDYMTQCDELLPTTHSA